MEEVLSVDRICLVADAAVDSLRELFENSFKYPLAQRRQFMIYYASLSGTRGCGAIG